MNSKDIIDYIKSGSCADCIYLIDSQDDILTCPCGGCELKDAVKEAIKKIEGIDKTKERLKEIEKNRQLKPHDSNFWEGFYLAEEIILEYLGGYK